MAFISLLPSLVLPRSFHISPRLNACQYLILPSGWLRWDTHLVFGVLALRLGWWPKKLN